MEQEHSADSKSGGRRHFGMSRSFIPAAYDTAGGVADGTHHHIAFSGGTGPAGAVGRGVHHLDQGVTLAQQGYLHASTADQVAGGRGVLPGDVDLVLLVINEDKVIPEIRYEPVA